MERRRMNVGYGSCPVEIHRYQKPKAYTVYSDYIKLTVN